MHAVGWTPGSIVTVSCLIIRENKIKKGHFEVSLLSDL